MHSTEIMEESDGFFNILMTDCNEENDDYDENLDDYDRNNEDNYDDGIAKSTSDDSYEDDFDDDTDDEIDEPQVETVQSGKVASLLTTDIEDSLIETQDYDEIED